MQSGLNKLGIYISYDEHKWGNFRKAVGIANSKGYVIWGDTWPINVSKFVLPTTIVIKIKGQDRYYKGDIKDIKVFDPTTMASLLDDRAHRPPPWRSTSKEVKRILYIGNLREVPEPDEVAGKTMPQHPNYIEFDQSD